MGSARGLLSGLAFFALLAFAINLGLLTRFPIYVDESQWKIIGSRIFLDGFQLRYLFPACTAGYLQQVPITWIPSRVLDAALYGDASQPMLLRIIGIVSCLFILGAIGAIAPRPVSAIPRWLWIALVAATLSSFGVLLPLLVMNRPEQGVLIPFIVAVLLYVGLSGKERNDSAGRALLLILLFVLLSWMMLAAHIKSFALLPAMFLMAASIIRRRWLLLTYAALVAWCFVESYSVWAVRTDCPELPHLQTVFGNLSLTPRLLLTDAPGLIYGALRNLADAGQYVHSAQYAAEYQSAWFPTDGRVGTLELTSNMLLFSAFGGLVVIVLAGTVAALRCTVQPVFLFARPGTIAVAILCGLLCLAAYQTTKNFYEMALVWPLLAVAAALAARSIPRGMVADAARMTLTVGFALFALSGHIVLLSQLPGSFPLWAGQALQEAQDLLDVDEVASACKVGTDNLQSGLVVDGVAFRRLWGTERPVLIDFFSGWWATGVDKDKAITTWPIKALVSACERVPDEYRSRAMASSNGRYCCVQF